MSADDDWSTSSTEALILSLVAPSAGGVKTITNFHPQFTYPIFGDDEQIFGYKGLQINVRYNANDMRPNLSITYKKKFQAVGETEAADINEILHDFLPEVAFQKSKEFEAAIKAVPETWTPPGEVITTFTTGSSTYQIFKGNLSDPAVLQLVKRIQFLVPLFIEGGTQIDLEDPELDRWTLFFIYEKRPVPAKPDHFTYVFAGYCTVYLFYPIRPLPTPPPESPKEPFALDSDFSLSQLPCRSRISQFIIIPPFQNKGLGPRLYSTIFAFYHKHPQTFEITVEDPNEAFDDLRDIADLQFLRQEIPEFDALRINTAITLPKNGPAPNNIVDKAACEAVRAKAKIAPRQFYRLLEMHLMSKLPEAVRPGIHLEDDQQAAAKKATKEQQYEYRLWRLLVKKRIYIHNKDALGELEVPERVEKLGDTVSSVEFDFARLLEKGEAQRRRLGPAVGAGNGKRKSVDDGEKETGVAKKARLAEEAEDGGEA